MVANRKVRKNWFEEHILAQLDDLFQSFLNNYTHAPNFPLFLRWCTASPGVVEDVDSHAFVPISIPKDSFQLSRSSQTHLTCGQSVVDGVYVISMVFDLWYDAWTLWALNSAVHCHALWCSYMLSAPCTHPQQFWDRKFDSFEPTCLLEFHFHGWPQVFSTTVGVWTLTHHICSSSMDLISQCDWVAAFWLLAGHCRQSISQVPDIAWVTSESEFVSIIMLG